MKRYSIRKRLIFSWFMVSVFTIGERYIPSIEFGSANANSVTSSEELNPLDGEQEQTGTWLTIEDIDGLFHTN